MNVAYIDRLSVSSLFAVAIFNRYIPHIFYFNATQSGKKLAKIFKTIGILKGKTKEAEFCLGEIGDELGECQFIKISDDLRDICFKISEKEFTKNFLKSFNKIFDFQKILLFFEKALSEEIHDTIVFTNVIKWYLRCNDSSSDNSALFFIEKSLWSSYITQYAVRLNVKAVEYNSIISSYYINCFNKVKKAISSKVKSKLGILKKNKCKNNDIKKESLQNIKKGKPLLASWYTGKSVTFDLKKRSDFFWFLKSDIPREQILIYFERKEIPAPLETVYILEKEGVKFLALNRKAVTSDNIPFWHPTVQYKKIKKYFICLILRNFILNALKFRFIPFFYLFNMVYFIERYSYWYDFFNFYGIKVNIFPDYTSKLHVPMNLALENNGGISIAYQWSNLICSSVLLSMYSNVLFLFSDEYRWIFEKNSSQIDTFIYCGYITDYTFKEVRDDSFRLREQLHAKGVKFIICYFDENSFDSRMSIIPNQRSIKIYKYFINKLLEDKTLGIIFKPGYINTFYQRMHSILDLIEDAKKTNRCIFLDKGHYKTDALPTEAAQSADLCVGLLLSGTVALESYLSGTPTVFLDLEKLYSNPIYSWGKNKVVFDSLDDLFFAIQKYRKNPQDIPGFANLSLWAKGKDNFRDGNASLRIGQYIHWLLQMFNQGKTREMAIAYANSRYAEIWGSENIVFSD